MFYEEDQIISRFVGGPHDGAVVTHPSWTEWPDLIWTGWNPDRLIIYTKPVEGSSVFRYRHDPDSQDYVLDGRITI